MNNRTPLAVRKTAALHRGLPVTAASAPPSHAAAPLRPERQRIRAAGRRRSARSTAQKRDAQASPDVDAFLDSHLAHRSQQDSDALRPLDERVLTLLARHKLSAPRLGGLRARV